MLYEKNGLYVDDAHLEGFAENFARSLRPDRFGGGRTEAAALRRTLRELRALHEALVRRWDGVPAVPAAAQWLLDNDYLVRREGWSAAEALSGARFLRFAGDRSLLLHLCENLVRCGLFHLSETRIAAYLRGFQRSLALEWAELGLLGAGLRVVLLSALPELYRRAEREEREEDTAEQAERIITALRFLSDTDLGVLTESVDLTEQALCRDPAGVYPEMNAESRAEYRFTLARLARREGLPELSAARRLLELSEQGEGARAHVGWWLYREPLGGSAPRRSGRWYIAVNVLAPIAVSLLAGFALHSAAPALLLPLPLSELLRSLLDFLLLRTARPAQLPRLALRRGVPPEGRTLCVVSVLLTGEAEAKTMASRLEEARLLSRDAGQELRFALLADLPDADAEVLPGDAPVLRAAAEAVEALNRRYGGGFFLLTRPRRRNRDGRWTGWERKRGALLETARALRGHASGVTVAAGDRAELTGTRFLLALDGDSRLSPGAARGMIAAMLHPLNAPTVDITSKIVRSGYGILSPRIGVRLADAVKTDFARVFAGQGGVEPYRVSCSDVYMDRWNCGLFAGKGLIDVDALFVCMDGRVPEGTMLSHDAVEGAVLRAGYLGDTECSDGFPGSVLSWLARQERWTRGDWQNLPWLFRRGAGLEELRRWRLLDSLRRSLVPVGTLAALLCGFLLPRPGFPLAAAAALSVLLSELLLLLAETLLREESAPQRPFSAALFTGLGGALARTLLRLLLLSAEALCCLGAALKALWRMLVSHRRGLEWTTAAQSEQRRAGLWGCCRALWPSAALGASLLLFAPGVIGKAAGFLWLLTPLTAYLLSLPRPEAPALSGADRDYLRGCAADTWRYFRELLGPEDHFLPPDNVQERPPLGPARRTSPTNIGLGLLSVLAALDLGLTDRADALRRISGCLDTLEALPKWHGHLYNWYRTDDPAPLAPRSVSTVDSGNLCACLIALSHGLRELGEEDEADRAAALAGAMDFAPLFDRKRRLFFISVDTERGVPSESHYDLLSSEARLTAYLAVARGDVPPVCWRRLSRAQLASGRRRGLASWTGTAFEYWMPELLLPLLPHSLLHEASRFCLYVQRRRGGAAGVPWGCSESAYAALDSALSYRYKAHGCAGLALRRGMDEELVVAPYASFLALCLSPAAALRNLRRLEALGLRGPRGFWEAVDFTPARAPEGCGAVVRCVMAHHQGMSLVAAANALCGGVMQRRFLDEPCMAAYRLLLEEKVPVRVRTLRRGSGHAGRGRRGDGGAVGWSREGVGTDFLRPACALLASRDCTLLLTETGLSRLRWGGVSPYLPGRSLLDRERGLALRLSLGGETHSLLPEPEGGKSEFRWRFATDRAVLAALHPRFRCVQTVSLGREAPGERRSLELRFDREADATLELDLVPLLCRAEDAEAQPAFWALGLSVRMEAGCLLIRRLARGTLRELWACVAMELPFTAEYGSAGAPVGDAERFLTEPLLRLRCPLPRGKHVRVTLALGLSDTAEGAPEAARRLLLETVPADLARSAAAVLGLDEAGAERCLDLLPELAFPAAVRDPVRREQLWRFGLSGDLPIVCVPFGPGAEPERARRWLDAQLFLSACGQDFDLVFLTRDGAGYQTPQRDLLERTLRRGGGELLLDRRGGVHILAEGDGTDAVVAAAALVSEELPPAGVRQTAWRSRLPDGLFLTKRAVPDCRWAEDGAFEFLCDRALPTRAWQNLLSNGRLSCLVTERGFGGLWYRNARELQLTPWTGRPWAQSGQERLLLEGPEGLSSLFAGPGGETLVRFRPGAAEWVARRGALTVRMAVFVPPDTDARVLLLRCEGPTEGRFLHWQSALRLGGEPSDARFCLCREEGGALIAESARFPLPFRALAAGGVGAHTFRRASAEALRYDGAVQEGEPVFAARVPLRHRMVLVCGVGDAAPLRALTEPDAAEAALRRTLERWDALLGRFRLGSTVPALDRLCNGWLAYQVLAGRLLGRASLYQCGGAFGFRDQLQDALNLIGLDPAPAREQLLRCCARQYAEGDVQHWWHEGTAEKRGLRTRCSDDLLWLPWAAADYAERTGDAAVLAERLPFLRSAPLAEGERDRYEAAPTTEERCSVAEHCRRALRLVLTRGVGPHGLLPIGSGDWNDGFDRVGGESVWLSWFFLLVSDRAGPLLGMEAELAPFCAALAAALDRAWDGAWYLRGYYADGTPLGSHANAECRIDSLAQSFAALSGRADPEKVKTALDSACRLLHDREHGLVKLFDPPFAGAEHPGYLESYGPGFRENGGQYTHAALWLALALLKAGETDRAWALLRELLPAAKDPAVYGAEPFVLAADVSAAPGHEGEAGWSWYTGAAGWAFRILTEELLGLRLRGGKLYLRPNLPAELADCTAVFHGRRIEYENGRAARVDGQPWQGEALETENSGLPHQ